MNWALAFGRSVAPALRTRPRAHGGATEEAPYGTLVKVVYVSRSPVPRASVRGSSMGSPVESAAGALDVVGRPFGFVLHGARAEHASTKAHGSIRHNLKRNRWILYCIHT